MIDQKKIAIRPIDPELASPWITRKHYARRLPNIMFSFGMFADSDLVGIVTYGSPASPNLTVGIAGEENKHLVLELNRLFVEDGIPSTLVSKSLKMLPRPRIVVSYADTKMGHIGFIYQASNFFYTGCTKERTDIFSNGHSRHNHGEKNKRQHRSAKHRYVYLVGSKIQKRYLKKALNYKPQAYPKGNLKYYETGEEIPKQMLLI